MNTARPGKTQGGEKKPQGSRQSRVEQLKIPLNLPLQRETFYSPFFKPTMRHIFLAGHGGEGVEGWWLVDDGSRGIDQRVLTEPITDFYFHSAIRLVAEQKTLDANSRGLI
jgi:hypothetical protein